MNNAGTICFLNIITGVVLFVLGVVTGQWGWFMVASASLLLASWCFVEACKSRTYARARADLERRHGKPF